MEENWVIGIGNRIRYLRGGESLPSFAKKLGIHKNTLVRYEKEESLPDVGFVLKLCKIIDNEAITPSWLIEGEGPMPSPGYFKAHEELRGRLSNLSNIEKAQEVIETAGLSITPERLVGYIVGNDMLSDLELYELCTKIAYYDFEAVKRSSMPIEQESSRCNESVVIASPVCVLKSTLLREIIELIEGLSKEYQKELSPEKKAEIIAILYEEFVGDQSKIDLLQTKSKRLFNLSI